MRDGSATPPSLRTGRSTHNRPPSNNAGKAARARTCGFSTKRSTRFCSSITTTPYLEGSLTWRQQDMSRGRQETVRLAAGPQCGEQLGGGAAAAEVLTLALPALGWLWKVVVRSQVVRWNAAVAAAAAPL